MNVFVVADRRRGVVGDVDLHLACWQIEQATRAGLQVPGRVVRIGFVRERVRRGIRRRQREVGCANDGTVADRRRYRAVDAMAQERAAAAGKRGIHAVGRSAEVGGMSCGDGQSTGNIIEMRGVA